MRPINVLTFAAYLLLTVSAPASPQGTISADKPPVASASPQGTINADKPPVASKSADSNTIFTAALTSGLSLLGVILGFLWNAKLQREADQRKVASERERDDLQASHNARVLRAITRAELKKLVNMFKSEAVYIADGNNYNTWIPIGDFFSSFKDNVKDFGLLSTKEVECITDTYYTFQEQVSYLSSNGKPRSELVRAIGFDLIDQGRRDWLRGCLGTIVESAEAALAAIDEASARDPKGQERGAGNFTSNERSI